MKGMPQPISPNSHRNLVEKEVKKAVEGMLPQPAISPNSHRNLVEKEVKKAVEKIAPQPVLSPNSDMKKKCEVAAEMTDRESRKKIFMLFRLAEAMVDDDDHEKRVEADKDQLLKIIQNTLGIGNMKKEEFERCERVGESAEESDRPLRISLTTETRKTWIFKNLIKLRGTNSDHLSFCHDLTKMERETPKKWLMEAKAKTEASGGKSVFRLRGPPWRFVERRQ